MSLKGFFTDAAVLVSGSFVFGLGVRCFLLPHAIVPGGITGIAITLGELFDFPVGVASAALNLPLVLLAMLFDGKGGFLRAILGIAVSSLTVDSLFFLPPTSAPPALCALGGSALSAVGLAIALMRGFTSGGSDLAAHLIRLRYTRLSMGRLVLLFDGTVILLSAVAMQNFAGFFYSVLAALSFSFVLDLALTAFRRSFSLCRI